MFTLFKIFNDNNFLKNGNNSNGEKMKRLYKFGYITGWLLLIISIFFIFSIIIYINKITLFDIICTILVIVISIKYFIDNIIYSYKYILRGEELFIYKGKRIKYQIDINKIELIKGFFDVERRMLFESNNKRIEISMDYDNDLISLLTNKEKNKSKRVKWYILSIIVIIFIIFSIGYVIYKLNTHK